MNESTATAGLTAVHQPDIVVLGSQWWTNGGMAVADFNRDGFQDVYWTGGGQTLDKLFINNGDGTFTDRAEEWQIADAVCAVGASAGDYDGDGWIDIYVTVVGDRNIGPSVGRHRLYRNLGGTFVNVAEAAGVNFSSQTTPTGYGSAFGDYDLDGDLDLFVSSWHAPANGNRLYRNNGDGTFTDVTESAIGTAVNSVWGFQSVFADMNGDRYPEILLSADFGTTRFLLNLQNGQFQNITSRSGTGLDSHGMGNTVGDFNRDGLFDWYVTSIHNSPPLPGVVNGNMLYINQDNNSYMETSVPSGVNDGGWGWGTVCTDLDNDGWVDIVEVNGRPTQQWLNEPAKLFRNNGDLTFTELAAEAGLTHADEGTAVARFDADNDGAQDILIFTNASDLEFFHNTTTPIGNWLRIAFDTSNNPLLAPDGFGTRVVAEVGEQTLIRLVDSGPSYLGTSEFDVHFGLGDATTIDTLRIEWTRGYDTILTDVAVNQSLLIVAPEHGDINADGLIDVFDLLDILSDWGACPVDNGPCRLDLNLNNEVDVFDLLAVLENWS